MSHSPEIECLCNNRVSAGWDERGEKERCVDCGSVYLIQNDGEVWLESETDEQREADAEAAMERQAEYGVDDLIMERKEREGK